MAALREQVGTLTTNDDARLSFPEIAKRWMDATKHTLKPSSITRRESCIKNLTPFFAGVSIRNVQPRHCERWLTERGSTIAAQTLAHELNVMRGVFDFAIRHGLMLANPAKDIKRRRIAPATINVPTREQFKKLVEAIRLSDGRLDSQKKAKPDADLVELLAYSGCRLGGAVGTKNNERRTVPMTEALRRALLRIKQKARNRYRRPR